MMQAVPSRASGYNPLRWRCADEGCYNLKQRPKIEIFAVDLPGKGAFTDIDSTVEINGHFLFLEFKSMVHETLPVGQRIYFQRLSLLSKKITIVVARCEAETMEIGGIMLVRDGRVGPWEECNLEQLHGRIRQWANAARMRAAGVRAA